MEDNNYRHEDFDDCFLCKHPALRHFLTGLLVFLGAFAAFYVVADWHFKRMFDPAAQMRRIDRAVMQREKNFNKMERYARKQQERMEKKMFEQQQRIDRNAAQYIHVEQTPETFKIIIDLKPFDNDEKNVEVKTNGNMLTINAAGERNRHNKHEIIKYSQTFAFGDDVDLDDIMKIREGNNYIITIPYDK